nr:HAMP domain-containing sensor histidine kinase [Campylobacter lanienae]
MILMILRIYMSDKTKSIEDGLKSLIEQTYLIEKEYKILGESYANLQKFTQGIVESLGASLWAISTDGEVVLSNDKAKQIMGILDKINMQKSTQEIEFDNRVYAIKITHSMKNQIILATDITDEKRAARLVSMGAVAAHLSHEIRNPIGSISLLTSTLLKRIDEKNRPLILEIQKAIYRVERIIKATLLFTKGVHIKAVEFKLENLEILCREAINQYAFSKEIEFKFSGFDGVICGDIDLLDLVFSNFIFNAIDAIEESDDESGSVSLEHKFENGSHHFYISDSGVKLPSETIFEPFKTTKLKGNGLGLALSLEIINAHKGSVSVQSEPKIFTITIP